MELIKTEEGYYVPKKYLQDCDGSKVDPGSEEHVYAVWLSYYYDKETGKWCLEFVGADNSRYDVRNFVFFFDSEEDLLKFLKNED